jgi:amidase
VAAGLVTVSISTETDGSIVFPGLRAALYCLKPTAGFISQEGVIPISQLSDSISPMTKNNKNVATMLDVIVDPSKSKIPASGYISCLSSDWDGLIIGAVGVESWLLSSFVVKPVESLTQQVCIRQTPTPIQS